MDPQVNEKIDALRNRTRDFVKHERESLSQYGGSMLREVEALVIEAVENASSKVDSLLVRVSESVRKEPFVALAAFAITGIAVFNLLNKRRSSSPPVESPAPEIKH